MKFENDFIDYHGAIIVRTPYSKTEDSDYFTDKRNFATMRSMYKEFAFMNKQTRHRINLYRETSPRVDSKAISKDKRESIMKCGYRPVYEDDHTIHSFEFEHIMYMIHFSECDHIPGIDFHEYPHDNLSEYVYRDKKNKS